MQASFNDVAGSYSLSVEDTVTFMKAWYQPEDLVAVPRRNQDTGKFTTVTDKARTITTLTHDQLHGVVFEPESIAPTDVYFGVCPINRVIVSQDERGTERDVPRMPGVWIDLDVKPGAFASKNDAQSFLEGLPMKPTILVDSGTGIHGYWRFAEVDVAPDKELSEAWQAYVRERAGDVKIDKTADLARVLRLPGTVHTGKGSGVYSSVRLLKVSPVAYRVEDVRELVKGSVERLRAARAAKRSYETHKMNGLQTKYVEGPLALLYTKAYLEDIVNEMDWADILEPVGWTLNREYNGQREWTRPGSGQSSRSAVTDWESSNVMSLLSESEDTLLADLNETTDLTKTRVMLRLWFSDDEDKMLGYRYEQQQNAS